MIATSSTNGRHVEPPPVAVGENIANLAQDILTLVELQAKLFWADLQTARIRALLPAMVLVGAVCLLLGTTPILLLAATVALSEWLNLNIAIAGLIVAGLSLCASVGGVWWAANGLMQSSKSLVRSRDEFQENLSWIKSVIRQSTMGNRS